MQRTLPDRESIETKIASWPAEMKAVAMSLLAGETLQLTAINLNESLPMVRTLAKLIGWSPRWRKFGNNSAKLFGDESLPFVFAKEKYLEGLTLQQIADIAGCTRERVRQVLYVQGVVPRRDVVGPRTLANAEKRAAEALARAKRLAECRDKNHTEHYAPWRKMWADGVPMHHMAARLGLERTAIGATICKLRAMHPDWFPYRHAGYGSKKNRAASNQTTHA